MAPSEVIFEQSLRKMKMKMEIEVEMEMKKKKGAVQRREGKGVPGAASAEALV